MALTTLIIIAMERDEITWNDLPNEIHEHIFQYLDITQEPGNNFKNTIELLQ